jgi:hypothetical protein
VLCELAKQTPEPMSQQLTPLFGAAGHELWHSLSEVQLAMQTPPPLSAALPESGELPLSCVAASIPDAASAVTPPASGSAVVASPPAQAVTSPNNNTVVLAA